MNAHSSQFRLNTMNRGIFRSNILALLALQRFRICVSAANMQILLLSKRPSHRRGDHEFRAGSLLLQRYL
jgi:hypothetical protein